MNRTTHKIIWNYTRMNRWLGYEDLRQEAAVAQLESGATWREDGGANPDTYSNRAVALRLRTYVRKQRSPVSSGAQGVDRKMDGVIRVCFENGEETPGPEQRDSRVNRLIIQAHMAIDASIERRLDMERAAAAIRRLVNEQPDGWIASGVLLDERKTRDVAKDMGIRAREVRRAVREVKQALAQSPELRAYAEREE